MFVQWYVGEVGISHLIDLCFVSQLGFGSDDETGPTEFPTLFELPWFCDFGHTLETPYTLMCSLTRLESEYTWKLHRDGTPTPKTGPPESSSAAHCRQLIVII